jgi:hypothetical protein
MMMLIDVGAQRGGGTKSSKKNPFRAPTVAAATADDDDSKRGGKKGKDKKKGRGGGGGKNDDKDKRGGGGGSSVGSASRTGAVSTDDAKRPPKWKLIVREKYVAFTNIVWTEDYSPLAAHLLHAINEGKWSQSLTRHCLLDSNCLVYVKPTAARVRGPSTTIPFLTSTNTPGLFLSLTVDDIYFV